MLNYFLAFYFPVVKYAFYNSESVYLSIYNAIKIIWLSTWALGIIDPISL